MLLEQLERKDRADLGARRDGVDMSPVAAVRERSEVRVPITSSMSEIFNVQRPPPLSVPIERFLLSRRCSFALIPSAGADVGLGI